MSCFKIFISNVILQLFFVFLALILLNFSTIKSNAATYTQTQTCTLSLQITNWSRSCSVPRFNPSLGTLESVRFEVSANINSTASVESRDMSATTVTVNVSANVTLFRPDNSTIAAVLPSTTTNTNFTAYDGTTDFAGTSGAVLPNLLASEASTITSTAPADLALFTGVGNITTPVTATGLSSFAGSANLATLVDTQAAASINVIYSYQAQDLSILKTHTGIFTAGTQGVYNITVTNKESSPTFGTITVVDTLPAGLSFVSNSNASWSCGAVAQLLTCTSSDPIAANGSSSFFITLNVANSTLSSITNTAQVSSNLPDPIPGDDTSADPTVVNHLPTVSNTTVTPITPGSTVNLPATSILANPNDISDSIANYTITALPDPIAGTIYLGNPTLGGTAITIGQILSPADISNIFFTSTGTTTTSTSFTFTAQDILGGNSLNSGTVSLNIQNAPPATSPSVISANTANNTANSTNSTPTPNTASNQPTNGSGNSPSSNTGNINNLKSEVQAKIGSVLGVQETSNPSQNLIRTGGSQESQAKYLLLFITAMALMCLYTLSHLDI
jgi:hypothetical protein